MRYARGLIVAGLAVSGLCFLALLTRAAYEGAVVGDVSQATFSLLVMFGFLFSMGSALLASHSKITELAARRCATCGGHVYLTLRSLDRRRLLTCFSCGREVAAA